jgi:D-sedoheptulose 7-phosphate isomerase
MSIDIIIRVPSLHTPRIQEMHLLIEHIISELVEQELCKDD